MQKKYLIILAVLLFVAVAGGIGIGYLVNHGLKTKPKTVAQSSTSNQTSLPAYNADQVQSENPPEASKEEPKKEETKKEETKSEVKAPEKPAPAPAKEPEPAPPPTYSPPSYNRAFQWGVTMRPNALGNYNAENWSDQIAKTKQLGANYVRLNWDYSATDSRNIAVIDALKANGLGVLLVIEHNPALGNGNMYQDGLNDGRSIASKVKDKVDFYQLANEGGAEAITNGTWSGVLLSHYDETRYNRVRDYIRGLSESIAANDPSYYRIVTISFTHTGFLDLLVRDNVGFDMVGIDWYNWMGYFGSKKISDSTTLFDKLKSFGKPMSFIEVNAIPSQSDGRYVVNEEKQANCISQTAEWAWNNRDWVKGFYTFELVDNVNSSDDYQAAFGIIGTIQSASGVNTFGNVRQAFNSYKDIIAGRK